MPGTYTKNVVLTGDSNTAGPDYTLVNVNNVTWASGTISSDATSCSFTVSDWTNPANLNDTRSSEFQIRHWLYNEANPLEEHYDSFTITQYANTGAVVTTTTQAPTTSTTTIALESPPPTTTQAPTTSTSTTSTTSTTTTATIAPAIELDLESLTIQSGNQVDDINFTIQPGVAVGDAFTPISAEADPTSPGSIVFFRDVFGLGEFAQVNQPNWIAFAVANHSDGIGTLTISTTNPDVQILGGFKIRITHPDDGTIFDEVNITKLRTGKAIKTYTFEWEIAGDNANYQVYNIPEHYEPQAGDDDITDLSQTYPGSIAGPNFRIRADFRGGDFTFDSSGAPILDNITITEEPSDEFGALVEFLEWAHEPTLDLWEAVFQVNELHPQFPGNTSADVVASITAILGEDVAGTSTSLTYNVIIDRSESCHVTGTLMNLDGGLTKPVEDLQVGDILESYMLDGLGVDATASPWDEYSKSITDFRITKTTATVTSIKSSSWHQYFHINNITKVTAEHPILIKRDSVISFKQVNDVEIGDQYYSFGAWINITSKVLIEEDITAYSIDVEESDVYMADGILWHNVDFGISKVFVDDGSDRVG